MNIRKSYTHSDDWNCFRFAVPPSFRASMPARLSLYRLGVSSSLALAVGRRHNLCSLILLYKIFLSKSCTNFLVQLCFLRSDAQLLFCLGCNPSCQSTVSLLRFLVSSQLQDRPGYLHVFLHALNSVYTVCKLFYEVNNLRCCFSW